MFGLYLKFDESKNTAQQTQKVTIIWPDESVYNFTLIYLQLEHL